MHAASKYLIRKSRFSRFAGLLMHPFDSFRIHGGRHHDDAYGKKGKGRGCIQDMNVTALDSTRYRRKCFPLSAVLTWNVAAGLPIVISTQINQRYFKVF
ncbi:hypothetical protein PUN28_010747 [Cardiocondyla obscurior]|uniref:Uncharacterized protein n=1 Tax=Cardiocondyla obscurior TaxID=286306 RepID=A0AAW2FHL1_9HYME